MFAKKTAVCPVCGTDLGYLTKGEVCSFVCKECQWIYSWNGAGVLGKPVKLEYKKSNPCDCADCRARNDKKFYNKDHS